MIEIWGLEAGKKPAKLAAYLRWPAAFR